METTQYRDGDAWMQLGRVDQRELICGVLREGGWDFIIDFDSLIDGGGEKGGVGGLLRGSSWALSAGTSEHAQSVHHRVER